jgi:hypothetical protein
MSIEIIKDYQMQARKDYRCDACDAMLQSMVYPDEFDAEDLAILKKAEEAGWMIKKGEVYHKQVNKIYGDINTFRCRPEVLKIYLKYDLNDI